MGLLRAQLPRSPTEIGFLSSHVLFLDIIHVQIIQLDLV